MLQDGEIRRLGENRTQRLDLRVVAATNRPLDAEAAAGRFRSDLLYRLNVVGLTAPPLRDRGPDIGRLTDHYSVHPPGYGRLNDAVREAMALAARREALLLDPVYTGKAMAGLVALVRSGRIAAGSRVLFVHTGGLPAIFAYADKLGTWLSKAPRGGAG